MKNLKIAMILVAAVAFFCSCGDPEAPTVTLTGETNEFKIAEANEFEVVMTVKVDAPKGINALKGNVYYLNASDSVMNTSTFDLADWTEGDKTYEGTIKTTLKKEDVKDYAAVKFEVVATTKNDVNGSDDFTVTIVAPSFTEANFEWVRHGNNNPDLSAYGLKWSQNNVKATFAYIEPLNANAKLYKLTAADYNATSVAAITFPDAIERYKEIKADQSATYTDNVIASVYEGKTYVFNITKGTVVPYDATTNPQGTKVTIEGTVKTFEATPAVSAK